MAAYRRVDDLTVTCRLTACTPGSAPGPTLGIEYGKPFTFYFLRRQEEILIGVALIRAPLPIEGPWQTEMHTKKDRYRAIPMTIGTLVIDRWLHLVQR